MDARMLGVLQRLPGPVDIRVVAPSQTADCGAAADLGVGVLTGNERLDAALVAGLSGLAGGDSDGSFFTAGGVHLMAQVTGWLGPAVGLYGNVATRLLAGSGADYGTTSAAAGVAFRF